MATIPTTTDTASNGSDQSGKLTVDINAGPEKKVEPKKSDLSLYNPSAGGGELSNDQGQKVDGADKGLLGVVAGELGGANSSTPASVDLGLGSKPDNISQELVDMYTSREMSKIKQQTIDMGLRQPDPDQFQLAREMLNDPIPQKAPEKLLPQVIGDVSKKTGVDPGFLSKLIAAESGGKMDAAASTSSAKGLGQFTEGTRNAMLQKYGVDAWSQDPEAQVTATALLARDNHAAMTKFLGHDSTPGEDYMAHFLGAGGAAKFFIGYKENPDAPAASYVDPKSVEANRPIFFQKDGTPRSAAQVFQLMAKKVGDRGTAAYASGIRVPTTEGHFTNPLGGQPGEVPGMIEPGNIDLSKRPQVPTDDGGTATVRSMGVNVDGQEVLIPTVSPDGKMLSDEEAIQRYKDTGENLGKFNSPEASDNYAEALHLEQATRYGLDQNPTLPAGLTVAPQDSNQSQLKQGSPGQNDTWISGLSGYLENSPSDGPVSSMLKSIPQTGVGIFRGLSSGVKGFYDSMDNIADYLSQATGLPKGGLFNMLAQASDYWVKKSDELYDLDPNKFVHNGRVMDYQKFMTGVVGDILGGAVPGFTSFALDLGGMSAVKGYARNGITGALSEQGKTMAMGQIMKAASYLPFVQRALVNASTFGADLYAQTGGNASFPENVQAFASGLGAAIMTGRRYSPEVTKLSPMDNARISAFLGDNKNEPIIREALDKGIISNDMADQIRYFGYAFPDRSQATTLKIFDYIMKATPEEVKATGQQGEGIVAGQVSIELKPQVIDAALSLYQGASVDTVVHENAHLFFDTLPMKRMAPLYDWYKNETANMQNRPVEGEFFADKFTEWYMKNRMWENTKPASDESNGVFSSVAKRLNSMIGASLKVPDAIPPADVLSIFIEGATGNKGDMFTQAAMSGKNPIYKELADWMKRNQVAFHGTPFSFDKFSDENIGTGQGANSYGWGHYVAQSKRVAEIYREQLSPGAGASTKDTAARLLAGAGGDVEAAKQELARRRDLAVKNGGITKEEGDKWYKDVSSQFVNARGSLLVVNVPESSKLMNWDEPMSKQSLDVQKAIGSIRKPLEKAAPNANDDLGGDWKILQGKDVTGEQVYDTLTSILGSTKKASKFLDSIGIQGHQYLDQKSRQQEGGGTSNIVVYSDKNLSVVKKMDQVKPSSVVPGIVQRGTNKSQWERYQDWKKYGTPEKPYEIADKIDNAATAILYDAAKDTNDPVFGATGFGSQKDIHVNFDYLRTTNDIMRLVTDVGNVLSKDINDARRNVQSHKQTLKKANELLANDMGMTVQTLLNRQRGEAFNAEQAVAARMIFMSSAESLMKAAKDIVVKRDNSDDALIAFRQKVEVHAAIQAQFCGMRAEAGRTLNAFQISVGADKALEKTLSSVDINKRVLEQLGGRDGIEKLAQTLVDVDTGSQGATAQQVTKVVNEFRKPSFKDFLLKARTAAMLSGLVTHQRNIIGNTTALMLAIPERQLASILGIPSRWFGNNPDIVEFGEAAAMVKGGVDATWEAMKLAYQAVKTGQSAYGLRREDLPQNISPSPQESTSFLKRTTDVLWKGMDIPFRFLGGEDDFFRTMAYRMELSALAYRKAHSEGLGGADMVDRINELKLNPPEEMARQAMNFSEVTTFNNPLTGGMRLMQTGINHFFIGRFIFPFQRTPFNMTKYTMARSPLAWIFQDVRRDLATPGATREMAMSKIVLGSSLITLGGMLASQGLITGKGPTNASERNIWNELYQPYSLRIGNTWYSYDNLAEPASSLLGLAADFHDAAVDWKSATDHDESVWGGLACAAVAAVFNDITSKSLLQSATSMVNAISDPEHYGKKFIQDSLTSFMPTIGAQAANVIDPKVRSVRTILDAMVNKTPGKKQTLPPRRDIFGDVTIMQSLGPDWLGDARLAVSPVRMKKVYADDGVKEMLRLGMRIGMPDKTQTFGRIPVELSNEQYSRFMDIMGHETSIGDLRTKINDIVQSPSYQRLAERDSSPDGAAASLLFNVFRAARLQAKQILYKENLDIQNTVNQENFNKFNGTWGNE